RSERSRRLLVVLDFLVVGIDDAIVAVAALGAFIAAFRLVGFVDRLAKLHGDLHQRLGLRLDVVGIGLGSLDGALQRSQGVLDRLAVGLGNLVAIIGKRLLGRMDQA